MTEPLIELSCLNKSFFTEEVETRALRDVNLTIRNGEYVALMGPSGSGKSTLLSILGLLDEATSGVYELAGVNTTKLSRNQRAAIRNKDIGFVFQSFNLISDLSVEENVALPLTYGTGHGRSEQKRVAREVLGRVNMEHRLKHYPSQLSGGQQQRVAIARALVNEPSLILADEPTGNLDTENAAAVMDILSGLHEQGCTICMVTHDPQLAARVNRCVNILDGAVQSISEPASETSQGSPFVIREAG